MEYGTADPSAFPKPARSRSRSEDLDLCIACAKALQVRGDVVAGEVSDVREPPAGANGKITTEGDESK